jgi:UDP-N-acetylglucosamine kinase
VSTSPEEHRLSPEESRRRFHERIVPQHFEHGVPQDRPVLVIVAGQPGAGKTAAENRVRADLDAAVTIDADQMRDHHPAYVPLALRNDRLAAPATHPDAARWVEMAMDYCIKNRFNVVFSTTMRAAAQETIDRFKDAGYRVEVAVVAVHEATSRLGVLSRYQDGRDDVGFGRYVPANVQREAYTGLLAELDRIDAGRLADAVHVFQRDGRALYHNELDEQGDWVRPAGTRAAVEAGRDRPWSPDETRKFEERAAELSQRLPGDLQPDLAVAVEAGRRHVAATRSVTPTAAEVAAAGQLGTGRQASTAYAGPRTPTAATQDNPRRPRPARSSEADQSR